VWPPAFAGGLSARQASYPNANEIVVTDPSDRSLTYQLSGALIQSLTDPMGHPTSFCMTGAGT